MAYFHAANPDALPAHAEPEQAAQILSLGYLSAPSSRPPSQSNIIPRKPSPTNINSSAPPKPNSRPHTPFGPNDVAARHNQALPTANNFQRPLRQESDHGQGQAQGRIVTDHYTPPMRLHHDQYVSSTPTPTPPRLSPPSTPHAFPPRPGSRTPSQEHIYRRPQPDLPKRITPPSQNQPFPQPIPQGQNFQRPYSPAPRVSPPSQNQAFPRPVAAQEQLSQKPHSTPAGLAPRPQSNSTATARPSDPALFAIFRAVDRDGSGLLSEQELNVALVNSDYTNFDFRTIALMVGMFDKDRKGRLSFEEFQRLWDFLGQWRRNFDDYDVDSNGRISLDEYILAVRRLGYSLPDSLVRDMFERYDTHRKGELSFDVFVRSVIKLRTITTVFKRYDLDRDGVITITYEDFVMEMLRESSN